MGAVIVPRGRISIHPPTRISVARSEESIMGALGQCKWQLFTSDMQTGFTLAGQAEAQWRSRPSSASNLPDDNGQSRHLSACFLIGDIKILYVIFVDDNGQLRHTSACLLICDIKILSVI